MQFDQLKRRHFITLLGGAAAWPLAALAQQRERMRRIGVLMTGTAADPEGQARLTGFLQGLQEFGWAAGRNARIDYRWAADDADNRKYAAELVALSPDVILASTSPSVAALQQASRTVPIVFAAVTDPLGLGLVASLARPGGNTTGLSVMSTELTVKRLELLKEIMPQAVRIAILQQSDNSAHPIFIKEIEPAAALLGLTHRVFQARGSEDFESRFALMRAWPADVVLVLDDATFIAYRAVMAETAARHRLPLICSVREITEAGCLFSYSVDLNDTWYRSATFVDKILKGAKPSNLPVQQGTKFEFAVNLKTARALGFDISPTLLARADEVIE